MTKHLNCNNAIISKMRTRSSVSHHSHDIDKTLACIVSLENCSVLNTALHCVSCAFVICH